MKKRDLQMLRLAHHLDYVAGVLNHSADTLDALIKESGGDADATEVSKALREVSEDAGVVSDNLSDLESR